jgi:hypothetical protein
MLLLVPLELRKRTFYAKCRDRRIFYPVPQDFRLYNDCRGAIKLTIGQVISKLKNILRFGRDFEESDRV